MDGMIRALQAKTDDAVVVATVKTIAPEGDIREFAVKLFENGGRGIGGRGKDSGLLVLLAVDERRVWSRGRLRPRAVHHRRLLGRDEPAGDGAVLPSGRLRRRPRGRRRAHRRTHRRRPQRHAHTGVPPPAQCGSGAVIAAGTRCSSCSCWCFVADASCHSHQPLRRPPRAVDGSPHRMERLEERRTARSEAAAAAGGFGGGGGGGGGGFGGFGGGRSGGGGGGASW